MNHPACWFSWGGNCIHSVSWLFLHIYAVHLHFNIFVSFNYCHVDYFLKITLWLVVCCCDLAVISCPMFVHLDLTDVSTSSCLPCHSILDWTVRSEQQHRSCYVQWTCFFTVGLQDLTLHKMWYCVRPDIAQDVVLCKTWNCARCGIVSYLNFVYCMTLNHCVLHQLLQHQFPTCAHRVQLI
jgi:hypothetical protein